MLAPTLIKPQEQIQQQQQLQQLRQQQQLQNTNLKNFYNQRTQRPLETQLSPPLHSHHRPKDKRSSAESLVGMVTKIFKQDY